MSESTEWKLSAPVLPDCRARNPTGGKYFNGAWWIQTYCFNCGCEGGLVPEETTTFLFWVCKKCEPEALKVLNSKGYAATPDEIFWETVRQEELEKYGRDLSMAEVIVVRDSDTSPLATLIKEHESGRKQI